MNIFIQRRPLEYDSINMPYIKPFHTDFHVFLQNICKNFFDVSVWLGEHPGLLRTPQVGGGGGDEGWKHSDKKCGVQDWPVYRQVYLNQIMWLELLWTTLEELHWKQGNLKKSSINKRDEEDTRNEGYGDINKTDEGKKKNFETMRQTEQEGWVD